MLGSWPTQRGRGIWKNRSAAWRETLTISPLIGLRRVIPGLRPRHSGSDHLTPARSRKRRRNRSRSCLRTTRDRFYSRLRETIPDLTRPSSINRRSRCHASSAHQWRRCSAARSGQGPSPVPHPKGLSYRDRIQDDRPSFVLSISYVSLV